MPITIKQRENIIRLCAEPDASWKDSAELRALLEELLRPAENEARGLIEVLSYAIPQTPSPMRLFRASAILGRYDATDQTSQRITQLVRDFEGGVVSLSAFRSRVESLFWAYPTIDPDDLAIYRKFENDLELVEYTVPESEQRGRAVEAAAKLLEYLTARRLRKR